MRKQMGYTTATFVLASLSSAATAASSTSRSCSKVGEGLDGKGLFGKWEDFSASLKPSLDACGGHFGVTPDSGGSVVYHYHIQSLPPFTIGCYGPDMDSTGNEIAVSIATCRGLYSGCGDGDEETVVTADRGTIRYDPWCPCFDNSSGSSNVLSSFARSARTAK